MTGSVDRECRIQLTLAKAIIFAVDELLNTRTCDVPSIKLSLMFGLVVSDPIDG